jgi:hypothetical protein
MMLNKLRFDPKFKEGLSRLLETREEVDNIEGDDIYEISHDIIDNVETLLHFLKDTIIFRFMPGCPHEDSEVAPKKDN